MYDYNHHIGKKVALLALILLQAQSFTVQTTISRCNTPSLSSSSILSPSSLPSAPLSQPSSKSQLFLSVPKNNEPDDDDLTPLPTYGGLLGKLTGLSLTAIRQSVRTTTGLSLTAARTTLRGLTGVSVNASLKTLFGIFPPWFRYFLQPFFIMYYTPLMIFKYFIGSTKNAKQEALAAHEKIVEGWKDAIKAAELAQDFWPLHVTDDGKIESLTPQSVPVTDIIVESLDIASTVQDSNKKKN